MINSLDSMASLCFKKENYKFLSLMYREAQSLYVKFINWLIVILVDVHLNWEPCRENAFFRPMIEKSQINRIISRFFLNRFPFFNFLLLLFLVTPCLVMTVQTCMELILIKKSYFFRRDYIGCRVRFCCYSM